MRLAVAVAVCLLARDARAQDSVAYRQVHRGPVAAMAVSERAGLVATGGVDRQVRLLDARTLAPVRFLPGHTGEVQALAFSRDGRLLASSGYDGEIRIWRVTDGRLHRRFTIERWSIAMAFLGGDTLVIGDQSGALALYDAAGAQVRSCRVDAPVAALAVLPGDTLVLLGGPLALWNPRTCEKARAMRAPGGVMAVAASDGALATAHVRGAVYRWTAEGALTDSAVSERAASIASIRGTSTDTVRVTITSVALSRDGGTMVYGDARGTLRLRVGGRVTELAAHRGAVSVVGLLEDAGLAVSAGTDGAVRLWRLTR